MKTILAGLFLACAFQILFLDPCRAEEQDSGLVEVHYPVETFSDYKERRRIHGANFGVHMVNLVPSDWRSLLDDQTYGDTYGTTPIKMLSFEAGYKFNFALGSLSALLGYGSGIAVTEVSSLLRDMYIDKYYAKVMYVLDNITREPYIAPYIAGTVWQMAISETEDNDADEYYLKTGIGFEYSAGLLIQLNWLEEWLTGRDSKQALADIGLQNAYVDIFVTQHTEAQGETAAPTATGLNYGAGLRLEF